jgi:hypothetical protein
VRPNESINQDHLAKVNVEDSNPFARSTLFVTHQCFINCACGGVIFRF